MPLPPYLPGTSESLSVAFDLKHPLRLAILGTTGSPVMWQAGRYRFGRGYENFRPDPAG